MMHDTTCRSAMIAVCLLLVCAALGSAVAQVAPRACPCAMWTRSAWVFCCTVSRRCVACLMSRWAYRRRLKMASESPLAKAWRR